LIGDIGERNEKFGIAPYITGGAAPVRVENVAQAKAREEYVLELNVCNCCMFAVVIFWG
jgi:hypothetical protein